MKTENNQTKHPLNHFTILFRQYFSVSLINRGIHDIFHIRFSINVSNPMSIHACHWKSMVHLTSRQCWTVALVAHPTVSFIFQPFVPYFSNFKLSSLAPFHHRSSVKLLTPSNINYRHQQHGKKFISIFNNLQKKTHKKFMLYLNSFYNCILKLHKKKKCIWNLVCSTNQV